jgi:hypothetical protein
MFNYTKHNGRLILKMNSKIRVLKSLKICKLNQIFKTVPRRYLFSFFYTLHQISSLNHLKTVRRVCTKLVDVRPDHVGHAVAQWLRHYATNRKVAGSIPMVSLEFFIDIIIPATL